MFLVDAGFTVVSIVSSVVVKTFSSTGKVVPTIGKLGSSVTSNTSTVVVPCGNVVVAAVVVVSAAVVVVVVSSDSSIASLFSSKTVVVTSTKSFSGTGVLGSSSTSIRAVTVLSLIHI